MDNLDEITDSVEAYVGPVAVEPYRQLMERDYAQDDPLVVMLTTALTNILEHDSSGDRPWKPCCWQLGSSKECWTAQTCGS